MRNKCDREGMIHWREETGAKNKNDPLPPPVPLPQFK